jgi:hypothetical protein
VNQIGRQFRQSVDFIVRPAVFDRHIAALDVPGFTQPFAKCRNQTCARFRKTKVEMSDHWHRPLLRPRCDRPSRRAAESGDEFAPSKAKPHLVPPVLGNPMEAE